MSFRVWTSRRVFLDRLTRLARAVVAVAGVADFEAQLADTRSELPRLAEREGA